jgi:ribosomal protein S18 acetylase RimI-like enzyme
VTVASVGIRRALASDAASLVLLERSSRAGIVDVAWGESIDWPAAFDAPGVYTYLAEAESTFGVVSIGDPRQGRGAGPRTGEVLAWYVAPDYRGQGYGVKLLVHGLSVMKRRAYEQALVWLPDGAGLAIHALSGLGFEETDRRPLGDITRLAFTLDLADYF